MKPKRSKEERSHSTCFFTLMLSKSQSKKLRIPNTFAKRVLSHEICSVAMLTVPTGETRKVELVEEDNKLWFRDGWQDFVESFSIYLGYFLMFKYEGKSNFNVHIFDLSACEIFYPCNVRNTTCLGHDHDQLRLDVIGNDVDDHNEESEMVHESADNSKESEVEIIQIDSDDDEEHMNHVKECTSSGYPIWLRKCEGLMKAVSGAGICLPENPFFVAAIKSYVLHKTRYLYIPKRFGKQHLGCETKLIKLEAHDGKQWEVKCVKDSTKYRLCGGWLIFAREIGLQVGDVCVFELTDANNCVLKVHVAKLSEICVADSDD